MASQSTLRLAERRYGRAMMGHIGYGVDASDAIVPLDAWLGIHEDTPLIAIKTVVDAREMFVTHRLYFGDQQGDADGPWITFFRLPETVERDLLNVFGPNWRQALSPMGEMIR